MKTIAAVSLAVLALAGPVVSTADVCDPRLLVLSAFPGEIDMFVEEAGPEAEDAVEVGGRTFYLATVRGKAVVLGITGIGLRNAEATTRAALEHFRCGDEPAITGVVFSGVSGGRTLIGDVTVPGQWMEADGDTWPVDPEMLGVAHAVAPEVEDDLARAVPAGDPACIGLDPRAVRTVELEHAPEIIVGGPGRSSDPFGGRTLPCFPFGGDVFGCRPCRAPGAPAPDVASFAGGIVPFIDPAFFTDYFANPPATSGADADDMETAASARVAAEHGVPFIAFRSLSDGEGDPLMLPGFPFQFFFYRQLAADNAATVALAFIETWPS